MADVFYKRDAQKLLKNKHIMFFGDSNARAIYKDVIWLLNHNTLIDQNDLRKKQEASFCGDKLGRHSVLDRGREYEEERSYKEGNVQVDFYFITKCYNPLLVNMMEEFHLEERKPPDVIYINSTLWDVSRWGPNGVQEFKENLPKLVRLFKSSLPTSTLVIWATALPISSKVQSSLLIKQIDFLQHTLRFDVMEANQYARQVMVANGFDVLDNHFHMRMQAHRRVKDGVHYLPAAIRLLTNLLLTHIALSWDFPLPDRVESILLTKAKALCAPKVSGAPIDVKTPDILSNKSKKKNPSVSELEKRPMKPNKKDERSLRKNKRQFPYQRNDQNRAKPHKPLPGTLHQALHQPGIKSINNRSRPNPWRIDSENQRRWSGSASWPDPAPWSDPLPPPRTGNYFINPWITNQPPTPNWSEDHWPDGQQYQSEQRFSSEQRLENNYNQSNSILARTIRQQQLLSSSMTNPTRFQPY